MTSPRPTLMLDDDGDILISDLGITRLTDTLLEEVAQRLLAKLQMFLGEWFLDAREGIPYHRDVFVKNPNLATIRSLYSSTIQGDEGVESLLSLELDYDPTARFLSVTFAAQLISGDVLEKEIGQFIV